MGPRAMDAQPFISITFRSSYRDREFGTPISASLDQPQRDLGRGCLSHLDRMELCCASRKPPRALHQGLIVVGQPSPHQDAPSDPVANLEQASCSLAHCRRGSEATRSHRTIFKSGFEPVIYMGFIGLMQDESRCQFGFPLMFESATDACSVMYFVPFSL